MALPLKVLNRLRLGRDLAARVPETLKNHSAWIYVYPLLDSEKGERIFEAGREQRIVSTSGESAIAGFLVRYLEVERQVVEDYHDGRLDEADYPDVDQRYKARTEEELAALLARWIEDFSQLHEPSSVGYVFDPGPVLCRD